MLIGFQCCESLGPAGETAPEKLIGSPIDPIDRFFFHKLWCETDVVRYVVMIMVIFMFVENLSENVIYKTISHYHDILVCKIEIYKIMSVAT